MMKALDALRLVERSLLVILFLSMVSLYVISVVAREVGGTFASQFAWIEEAVRLMNLFLVFIALGLALERGKHVCIDILQDRLPAPARLWLGRVIDAAGLVFSIYLAWLGVTLVRFVLASHQVSPTLQIPMGWVYMAPVIGFSLLGLRYGLSLFGVIDRRAIGGAE